MFVMQNFCLGEGKMLTTQKQDQAIYDYDILLWVETTVAKLKARDFENLDIDNLIEEVESLGISQKKELLNRLTTLLEHLLKRIYVNIPYDYNGWERTIRTQRKKLEVLLIQVPSLKSKWEIAFTQAWKIALKTVKTEKSILTRFVKKSKCYQRISPPYATKETLLENYSLNPSFKIFIEDLQARNIPIN